MVGITEVAPPEPLQTNWIPVPVRNEVALGLRIARSPVLEPSPLISDPAWGVKRGHEPEEDVSGERLRALNRSPSCSRGSARDRSWNVGSLEKDWQVDQARIRHLRRLYVAANLNW